MRVINIGNINSNKISAYGSRDAFFQSVVRANSEIGISILSLLPGGRIGMHEALSDQIMIPLSGTIRCRVTNEDYITAGPDEIVIWEKGENHETISEFDARILIIEGDDISQKVMQENKR